MKTTKLQEDETFKTTNSFIKAESKYSEKIVIGAMICGALILAFIVWGLLWLFGKAIA